MEEHFKWTFKDVVEDSDATIAMILHLSPIPNEKKRFIDFESFGTFLLNYGGTDFPNGISLCAAEVAGFVDGNGLATNVIANSTPAQISTVVNPGGIIGYNVLYRN